MRAIDRIFFMVLGAAALTAAVLWVAYGPKFATELQLVPGWVRLTVIAGSVGVAIWRVIRIQKRPDCPAILRRTTRVRSAEQGVLALIVLAAGGFIQTYLLQPWERQNAGPLARFLELTIALAIPSLAAYIDWGMSKPSTQASLDK